MHCHQQLAHHLFVLLPRCVLLPLHATPLAIVEEALGTPCREASVAVLPCVLLYLQSLSLAGALRLSPAAAGHLGAFGLGAASANTMLAAQQAALTAGGPQGPGDYAPLQGFVGFNNATGLAAAAAAAAAAAGASGMELSSQVGAAATRA